ncbi:unnamed protein product, partial [marine sediment metagenome]
MIVYHGTTAKRAEAICRHGFLPKRPSRRVWFASGKGYARGRAKTQARRARDRAVVLACVLNLGQLKTQLGPKRVFNRNGIIAINGPVPVSVIRSHPLSAGQPCSPEEIAMWANTILGLKHYKGVSPNHKGVNELSKWMVEHISSKPARPVKTGQLFEQARHFMPEFFRDAKLDPKSGVAYRVTRRGEMMLKIETPVDDLEERELE